MLNARIVILAALALAIISVTVGVLGLFRPPDPEGIGLDSYGVRPYGQSAVFEILDALHVPAERNLVLPVAHLSRDVVMAFLNPNMVLAHEEPAYLDAVGEWVRKGGAAVATGSLPEDAAGPQRARGLEDGDIQSTDSMVFQHLGAGGIRLRISGATQGAARKAPDFRSNVRRSAREFTDSAPAAAPATALCDAAAFGELDALSRAIRQIEIPTNQLLVIDSDSSSSGHVTVTLPDGRREIIAAIYPCGAGRLTVLSDPRLLNNRSVAHGDNALLAVGLLTRSRRPIVIDEFYHGLTVRGNAAWLLTRFPFGLIALMLVMLSALWIWRGAVGFGPPLAAAGSARRTLRDYLGAMAELLRGPRARHYLIEEQLRGGLWLMRRGLGLPPGRETADAIARAVARRDPDAARRIEDAAAGMERLLETKRPWRGEVLKVVRQFQRCLEKKAP